MYVREFMTTDIITVSSDTLVLEAERILNDHQIRHLPVVDKDKLVGLITRNKLKEATGHHATSLTVWELHYLLSRMKVNEIMETEITTVAPDTSVDDAMILAQQRAIGSLPVMANNRLVGMFTTTDLYRIIGQAFGFREEGARLRVIDPRRVGSVKEVLDVIHAGGANVRYLFHITPPATNSEDCLIHLDIKDATGIVNQLLDKGYQVGERTV